MKIDYSKDFEKSLKKLSGKMLDSVRRVIKEVKEAEDIKDITNCKKLIGYRSIYRIRIGDYRAIFTFHIESKYSVNAVLHTSKIITNFAWQHSI